MPRSTQKQSPEKFHLASLQDLDALVGKYVMEDEPAVYWEDSSTHARFNSVEEALDTMHDEYFQLLLPQRERAKSVLREVLEFAPYSSHLAKAMSLVARMTSEAKPLSLWHDGEQWVASFGENLPSRAETAPMAICMAALRARGVEAQRVETFSAEQMWGERSPAKREISIFAGE